MRPATRDLMACLPCREFYSANRESLVPACSSVGIEHGVSQGEALRIYLGLYHRDGHRELPGGGE